MDACITNKEIIKPLCKLDGTSSDHSIISASCKIPRAKKPVVTSFEFRPITTKGVETFKELLLNQDWELIKGGSSSVSAYNLNVTLQEFVTLSFPSKKRKIRSTDAPWFNEKIRRAINRKNRIYKAEGRSLHYLEAKKKCDKLIKEAKASYLGCIIDKAKFAGNPREFYKAVKILRTKNAPIIWDIHSLFPNDSDYEIAEAVAVFFNSISQEYDSIENPFTGEIKRDWPVIIEAWEIAARLKNFKKPKSQVPGDINPSLVDKFYDLLAIPLSNIFNQSLGSLSWPELWKTETVLVIPKNSAPAGLSELRNLSCTPLFSKLMESFVLERLKKEIRLSINQFGGIKGCSTVHFLAETWDKIMHALEDGNTAANLVSIDFEKAFNRMDHGKCLSALEKMGASYTSVKWVAAFLYGRSMSVRIGSSWSTPRHVPGGSPQGSILGNFLFCITTNIFAELPSPVIEAGLPLLDNSVEENNMETELVPAIDSFTMASTVPEITSTPSSRGQFARFQPPACLLDLSGDYQSEDGSFRFFRNRNRLSFDSSDEISPGEETAQVPNNACPVPISTFVYIDDFNTIEKVLISNAKSHLTTNKRKINIHAPKSEAQFNVVKSLAEELKMRVNCKKTQVLCIHANKDSEISSYITTYDGTIESTDSLKLLGFHFGREPNAVFHVTQLVEKFYRKLWSLRFLKKSGMEPDDLWKVYLTVILPSIEYCSEIYDSLIPAYLSDKLESVQRQAVKIVYGYGVNYYYYCLF